MATTRKPARKPKSTGSADTVYEMITERMVALLEAGTVPWRKPWTGHSAPRNIEGHAYRGINVFLLATQPYESPFWMTFNQAKARGGSVKKGEHGTVITFWKTLRVEDRNNADKTKQIPMLRYFRVFNLEQTEGVKLPAKVADWKPSEAPVFDGLEAAEAIVKGYPDAPRYHETGDEAAYHPVFDRIYMPRRDTFESAEEWYSTLFHEFGHSTGHPSRLNRETLVKSDGFGGHTYGREELIAEMTSAFLAAEAGITVTQENSAAYLAGWIAKIKEDVRAVVVSAGAAQRAADHILNRTYEFSVDKPEALAEVPAQEALMTV